MSRPIPPATILILGLLAGAPALADTLYRCPDGSYHIVGGRAKPPKGCRTDSLAREPAAAKGARCRETRYRNTIFRCCERNGVSWCHNIAPKASPADVAAAASGRTERRAAVVDPSAVREPSPAGVARSDLDAIIVQAASAQGIPEPLLRAVITVESGYRVDAVSPAGAQGLMQLMPVTQQYLSVDDPFDPAQNVEAGARLLRILSDKFHGDVERVVAAYYAGPTAVRRAGGVPNEASQVYVSKVLERYRALSGATLPPK